MPIYNYNPNLSSTNNPGAGAYFVVGGFLYLDVASTDASIIDGIVNDLFPDLEKYSAQCFPIYSIEKYIVHKNSSTRNNNIHELILNDVSYDTYRYLQNSQNFVFLNVFDLNITLLY